MCLFFGSSSTIRSSHRAFVTVFSRNVSIWYSYSNCVDCFCLRLKVCRTDSFHHDWRHETIQVHCKFQWVLLCYRMNVCFPYDIYVINYIIQFMRIEVYKFLSPVKVKSLTPFFRTHKIRCKACKFGHVRCFSFFFHSVVMFSLFQHSSE